MTTPLSISNMETMTDWIQPGNVGDDNGGGAGAPTASCVITPGKTLITKLVPQAPYADLYVYRQIEPGTDLSAYNLFQYSRQIMFPTQADIDACQAFEFELQKVDNGYLYNMAYQVDFVGAKALTTFDYNSSTWQPTYFAVDKSTLSPGVWYSLEALFRIDQTAHTTTHLGITIQDQMVPINITRPATPTTESNYIHAAYQLDADSAAQTYTIVQQDIDLIMIAPTSVN